MATYYSYKDRDIDKSTIDWSGLTKTISDNLMNEKKRRENLKLEIEEKHQEQLKKLNEYEQGLDPNANLWAMQQAQQARSFLLENHKMMKTGIRPVNDSKLVKQRVNDSWDTVSSTMKTYNEEFKRLSEKDDKGSEAQLKALSNVLNLSNKKIHYDQDGNGYYVSVDKKGNIDMNTALPIKAIGNMRHQDFESVNIDELTTKVASNVAEWKVFQSSTSDVMDPRQNKLYGEYLENKAKADLNTDQKLASALMDFGGLEYDLDGKPNKTNVTYKRVKEYKSDGTMVMEDVTVNVSDVEMKINPNTGKLEPKLSDEQKQLAKDLYKNTVEAKIGREATKDYVAPTAASGRAADEKASFRLITGALQGNKGDLQSLANEYGFQKISQEGDKIKIVDKSGNTFTVDSKAGISSAGANFASALGLSGDNYRNQVRINDPISPNFITNTSAIGYVKGPKQTISQSNTDLIDAAQEWADVNKVKSSVQKAASDLGIAPSRITIDSSGKINLDGKQIGTVGTSSGPEIAQQLEQVGQSLPPSDIRLKEDINLIGVSEKGINIYSWKYKEGVYDEGIFTGVIAQEVPWATVKVGDYLHVDYSKIDVEFNKIA